MDYKQLYLKYSFAANLFLLVLIAYFAADGVNSFISGKFMAGAVKAAPIAPADTAPAEEYKPDLASIENRDLFGSVAPMEVSLAEAADGSTSGLMETDLRLELIGIYYWGTKDPNNIATIKKIKDQETALFKIGATVTEDAVLDEIQWDRVILLRGNGARQELKLDQAGSSPAAPAAAEIAMLQPAPGRPGAPPLDFSPIEQTEPGHFVIPKELLEQVMAPENMNQIMTQARTIPNKKMEGDREVIDGFRIYRIRPGSIYQKLGLQNGDVLKSVNGSKLDNFEAALGLWQNLRGAQSFTLEVERQGQAQNYFYEIK